MKVRIRKSGELGSNSMDYGGRTGQVTLDRLGILSPGCGVCRMNLALLWGIGLLYCLYIPAGTGVCEGAGETANVAWFRCRHEVTPHAGL